MMAMKKLPLLMFSLLLLCSFGGEVKPFKRTDWIPTDFDARKSTLLVQQANFNVPAKQNQKIADQMKEIMQKEYPYKYAFASFEDIRDTAKYADTETYRWALVTNSVTGSWTYPNGSSLIVSGNDFHLYDRKLKKDYSRTGYSDSFVAHVMAPTIATLVKFLKELKN
jgi:hypothetical protein